MPAELEGMTPYLKEVYTGRLGDQIKKESATLQRLLDFGPPRRMYHREPPTPEQVTEFEAWKAEFTRLRELGEANDWLEWDYDDRDRPRESAPSIVVYDEPKEEWEARLKVWQDEVESLRPKQVVFPIATSVTATNPFEEEPDADQPQQG